MRPPGASAVAPAAQRIVFDHGRIVESGTHPALLEAAGEHAGRWHAQRAQ
ncbi:MAG: hypothetical protein ACK515_10385 [bacterium]|jgi:ABC-type multidrug transport system fused ATPase/permease subunit|nr:hypothetical protein [Betaproteobacteria bacterium]